MVIAHAIGRAQEDPDLEGMGTTVVALCFGEGGEAWVAHVGDSRLYLLRDGSLDALTTDHSLVAEMQRDGFLSPEEAQVHPRRNELLRSLGAELDVEIDIERFEVEAGDCYLLCTDGLCGVLEDAEIQALLEDSVPEAAAELLVAAANERGGPDNVTVQIAHVPPR